jgi:hypothetical protein
MSSRLLEINQGRLAPIARIDVDSEAQLETWLSSDLGPLGLGAMTIGRQVESPHGGRLDILALDRTGDLIVIEIKRGRPPREAVAQALDYASWASKLAAADVIDLYRRHNARELPDDFHRQFGVTLPEALGSRHRVILLAVELGEPVRRMVSYLANDMGLPINAANFQLFRVADRTIVAVDWLIDPDGTAGARDERRSHAANGIWFVNVGPDPNSDWEDNRRNGYFGVRGELGALRAAALRSGDWIFAYRRTLAGPRGYVGFGEVTGEPTPSGDDAIGRGLGDSAGPRAPQTEDAILVVPVRWIKTVPERDARRFPGIFANPNIVCRLTCPRTLEFLKHEFAV